MTTDEKNAQMAKKRNLEGNNNTSKNSSSALDVDDIVNISSKMGIVLGKDNFAAIDLVKDMEMDRNDLAMKQNKANTQDNLLQNNEESDDKINCDDESTDYDDFTMITPKRSGKKTNIRSLMSLNGKDRRSKENPAPKKPAKGRKQELLILLYRQLKEEGKKS
jgi:hypothetical protein